MQYSVLMSVYKKEKPEWLINAVESMLNQTVPPSDFVIVEDGPLPQELEAVVKKYEQNKIFTVVRLQKNAGLGPALAEGIQHTKYELVARMDADDVSAPERAEKLLKLFNDNPELCVAGTYEAEFETTPENVVSVHKVPVSSADIAQFMKKRCALLHPTVMYKKSAVLKAGNYKSVPLYEDYDLFMRMVLENRQAAANVPESLYYIRINDDFFRRRGGISYLKTAVKFKYSQYKKRYIGFSDFLISAGGQALVCVMPNRLRKAFYNKFLRR